MVEGNKFTLCWVDGILWKEHGKIIVRILDDEYIFTLEKSTIIDPKKNVKWLNVNWLSVK